MDRGTDIHKDIEVYLAKEKPTIAAPMAMPIIKYYENLRDREVYLENEIAFDKDWNRTDWFAKNAWCRVKMDAFVPAPADGGQTLVVDHKTGGVDKRTGALRDPEKYQLQMELYCLAGLVLTPWSDTTKADLVFVDAGVVVSPPKPYKRSQEAKLKKEWLQRVKPMLNDERFDPNPGDACRFCYFKKSNGGPCEY
jgi:hypothetical protein